MLGEVFGKAGLTTVQTAHLHPKSGLACSQNLVYLSQMVKENFDTYIALKKNPASTNQGTLILLNMQTSDGHIDNHQAHILFFFFSTSVVMRAEPEVTAGSDPGPVTWASWEPGLCPQPEVSTLTGSTPQRTVALT